MSWAAVISAGGAIVGGLLSKDQGSSTSTRNIDPRIVPYIYGASGSGGLLGNVNNNLNTQLSSGGLNPLQYAGLEMQRQTLMDPAYTSGFGQMRSLGAGLLGQGVAGNPFTGGQTAVGTPPPSLMGGGMRTIQPVQGGMRSALGVNPAQQAPQFMGGGNPNLGFNATTAPAYQPIQAQAQSPGINVGQIDLNGLLAQLFAQQQMKNMLPNPEGGGGVGGGGASGTGPGEGSSGTGIGGANGDGSGSPY